MLSLRGAPLLGRVGLVQARRPRREVRLLVEQHGAHALGPHSERVQSRPTRRLPRGRRLRRRLQHHRAEIRDALPKNAMGKLEKKKLIAEFAD